MLLTAIGFNDNCHEAINFYKTTLGAEVKQLNKAGDDPDNGGDYPPDFVMYSEVSLFGTTIVMCDGIDTPKEGFWLQVMFNTPQEVIDVFNKLADGGVVTAPPEPAFWAAMNANVKDRFGVEWNILTNS